MTDYKDRISGWATDIDWSKAPEGATHYGESSPSSYFYRIPSALGGSYDYCNTLSRDPKWVIGFGEPVAGTLLQRPEAWNGTGLPPVGTVCELRTKTGGWGTAEIKYMSGTVCVWLWIRHDGGEQSVEWAEPPYRLEFRPIRTPKQIAADEREAFARTLAFEMGKDPDSSPNSIAQGRRMYDLGYRKAGDDQ